MTPATSILRYLSKGQATTDTLSESLNLTLGCVETETASLIASGTVLTGSITIADLSIPTYRLSPKALQQLTERGSLARPIATENTENQTEP